MKEQNLILLGPEEGDKNERFEDEKRSLLSQCPDLEIETYYANDNCEKDVLTSLRQPSLFSPMRLIVLKYFEAVPKTSTFIKGLSAYMDDPEKDVYLIILDSDAMNPFGRSQKNLDSQIFYEEFDNNKMRWIQNEFAKGGFRVTPDGVEEIMGSVENNKADMKATIDGITSYYKGKIPSNTLTSEEISSVISREKGETGYTLFAAMASRDLEKSLLTLAAINLQDPRGLVTASSIVMSEFRLLEDCSNMRMNRASDEQIFQNATGFQTTFVPRPGISYKKKPVILMGLRKYKPDEIHEIVKYLAECDTELKIQGSEGYRLFQDIVFNVIVNGGKPQGLDMYPEGLEIKLP